MSRYRHHRERPKPANPLEEASGTPIDGAKLNVFELNHKIQHLLYAFAKETKVYDPEFFTKKSMELLNKYLAGGDYPGISLGEMTIKRLTEYQSGDEIADAWIIDLEVTYQGETITLSACFNAPDQEDNRLPGIYKDPFSSFPVEDIRCTNETLPEVDSFAQLLLDYSLSGGIYLTEASRHLTRTNLYFWPGYVDPLEESPLNELAIAAHVTSAVYDAVTSWPDLLEETPEDVDHRALPQLQHALKLNMIGAITKAANGKDSLASSVLVDTAIETITDALSEISLATVPINTSKAGEFLKTLINYRSYCSSEAPSDATCEALFIAPRYFSRALWYLCVVAEKVASNLDINFSYKKVFARAGTRLILNSNASAPFSSDKFLTRFIQDRDIKKIQDGQNSWAGTVVPSADIETHNCLADAAKASDNFKRSLDSVRDLPVSAPKKEEILKAAYGFAFALDQLEFDASSQDLYDRFLLLQGFLLADLEDTPLDVHALFRLKEISDCFSYAFQKLPRVKKAVVAQASQSDDPTPQVAIPDTPEFRIKTVIANHLDNTFNKTSQQRATARVAAVEAILGHAKSLNMTDEEVDSVFLSFVEEAKSGFFKADGEIVLSFGKEESKSAPFGLHRYQRQELDSLTKDFIERDGGPWDLSKKAKEAADEIAAKITAATQNVTILMINAGVSPDIAQRVLGKHINLAVAHQNTQEERLAWAIGILNEIFGPENLEAVLSNYPNLLSWVTWGYLSERELLKLSEHKADIIDGRLKITQSRRNRIISWKTTSEETGEPTDDAVSQTGAAVSQRLSEKADQAIKIAIKNASTTSGAEPSPFMVRLVKLEDTSGLEASVEAFVLLEFEEVEIAKMFEQVPTLMNPVTSKEESFYEFLFSDLLPALEVVGVSDSESQKGLILGFSRCIHPKVLERANEFVRFCIDKDERYCGKDEKNQLSLAEIAKSISSNKALIIEGIDNLTLRMNRLREIFSAKKIPFDRKDILVNHSALLSFVNISAPTNPNKTPRDEQIVALVYNASVSRGEKLTAKTITEASTLNPLVLRAVIEDDELNQGISELTSLEVLIKRASDLQAAIGALHTPAGLKRHTKITTVLENATQLGWTENELISYIQNFDLSPNATNRFLYSLSVYQVATGQGARPSAAP